MSEREGRESEVKEAGREGKAIHVVRFVSAPAFAGPKLPRVLRNCHRRERDTSTPSAESAPSILNNGNNDDTKLV